MSSSSSSSFDFALGSFKCETSKFVSVSRVLLRKASFTKETSGERGRQKKSGGGFLLEIIATIIFERV